MEQQQLFEEGSDARIMKNTAGFIGAFMHNPVDLEFVSLNPDDPKQGYFRIPQKEIIREMHLKNLIVSRASTFMAKRMAPTAWGAGISYLEVGTGVGTGTTQAPQAEDTGKTALRVPLTRVAITSWTYLDASGNPTASETNVIQLTTTFLEAQANGALVEMGLFGGDATATIGSGYMFNYKVFPVWNKDSTMRLTVVWKLTF